MTKIQNIKQEVFKIWEFRISNLFRISSLEFRISVLQDGYAALITTILVVTISLTVIGGFTFFAVREVNMSQLFARSIESRYISEGGMEDAIYRIVAGKQITSGETLAVGNGTTTILITASGTQRFIRTEGVWQNIQQNFETRIDTTVSGTNFPYGAQVGDGGLEMMNNSRIEGSVHSNGDIIGDAGATITGDAFVAVGQQPMINQSWETQNTDLNVGMTIGSATALVDSTGNVGTYTSLVLGSDGFARISYVDETNGDLKFVRCLDALCSAKNISAVDTGGVIGEVTSLTLGSDGFGRISYYHDGNDDLKFARCLNADCSSAVVTLVDAASNMGDFSSIKMASDGFARIAYWDDSNEDVEYARCTNADCTTKILTTVESSGNVGEYISLALGSDDFARISYYADSGGDLKFIRCTNADCTTKVITVVDSSGDVGKYTSLVLGSDGFARISYYNETNDDLKFVRCTNADCTSKNIATVDSSGTTGQYTSLALGSDGFPRISYYYSSSGDLRYARCTDVDCTGKIITTADSAPTVGKYSSLGLASGDLGRISYYDSPNGDLLFVQCLDANCTESDPYIDAAQSFQPTITDRTTKIQLYLKKIGNPANAMLYLTRDSSGSPSTNPSDILASTTINTAVIGSSYSWISFELLNTPNLSANTTYWMVIDASLDNSNYLAWGRDSAAGYTRGSPKRTDNWSTGGWINVSGDLNFRVFMGGVDRQIRDLIIGGNANAHIIENTDVNGDVNAYTFDNGIVGGDINANSISNCTVNGNASFNAKTSCTVLGSQTTPTTPPTDPSYLPLPIASSTIQGWKNDASTGGTCVQPVCLANGDYAPTQCDVSLGPKRITGNLILDKSCSGGQKLTLTGTLWVQGYVDISNNARVQLSPSYGDTSGLIVADGTIHLSNNGSFSGSGSPGSYIMFLTNAAGGGHHGSAIDLHNNAAGAIFYAGEGMIYLHNNVQVSELVGKKVHLENNAVLQYEIGLQNVKFSAGPSGGYDVKYWKAVE
ncbi:MAG: hypothetical protein HYT98_05120 [Candidatus Sungbacteria bacterium]|nr:hypothetical protein [Candidatus Sungbacteria bacterium]